MNETIALVIFLAVIFGPLMLMVGVAFVILRALRRKSWYLSIWLFLLAVGGVWTWFGVRDILGGGSDFSPGGFGGGWSIFRHLPRWYVQYAPGVATFFALLLCWPRKMPDETRRP